MAKSPLNNTQQTTIALYTTCDSPTPPRGQRPEQYRRIVSAAIILPPLLLLVFFASHELFLVLTCALIGLSLHEYFRLFAVRLSPVSIGMTYALACTIACTAYSGGRLWMPPVLSLSLMALTISAIVSASPEATPFPTLLNSLFGLLFIGWGLSHFILLRSLESGKWYILFLCVIIWVGDASAMYIGKGFGRHKLVPAISPGKTWEGALGGMLSSLLVAILTSRVFAPQLSLSQSIIFGLVVALAAQLSDLGESILKRYTGVKDSGTLIPGHGGVLDRIDSLFFAAPVAFYTLELLPPVSSL